jgi:carboxylesterase type B
MEGTLFAVGSFSNPLTVTSADYDDYLNITFGAELIANISAVYPISMFSSTVAPALYAIAAVITDAEYVCPTRRALKTSLTTQLGTYTYLWNHVPSCSWTPSIPAVLLSFLGPTHTSELAFVFDETSNLPQPNGTCVLSASEQILTIQIVTAWQSMSSNGYPILANGSKWPDWSQGEQGAIFDGSLTFGIINMTQCDFWDTIQMVASTNATTNNTSPMMTSVSPTTIIITLGAAAFYDGSIAGFVLATFFTLLNM